MPGSRMGCIRLLSGCQICQVMFAVRSAASQKVRGQAKAAWLAVLALCWCCGYRM